MGDGAPHEKYAGLAATKLAGSGGGYGLLRFLACNIGGWCNGSTTDSGSVCLGSNPSPPGLRQKSLSPGEERDENHPAEAGLRFASEPDIG